MKYVCGVTYARITCRCWGWCWEQPAPGLTLPGWPRRWQVLGEQVDLSALQGEEEGSLQLWQGVRCWGWAEDITCFKLPISQMEKLRPRRKVKVLESCPSPASKPKGVTVQVVLLRFSFPSHPNSKHILETRTGLDLAQAESWGHYSEQNIIK